MKTTFADTVTDLALQDPRVLLLSGDFCYAVFNRLKAERPKQYLNLGACEQSLVSVAAGMAMAGAIPFVFAITPFLLERAFEQVKLDIAVQQPHVILVGFDHYPTAGPTHQPVDPQKMCKLLKLNYYAPKTRGEVHRTTEALYHLQPPAFMRLRNL